MINGVCTGSVLAGGGGVAWCRVSDPFGELASS